MTHDIDKKIIMLQENEKFEGSFDRAQELIVTIHYHLLKMKF